MDFDIDDLAEKIKGVKHDESKIRSEESEEEERIRRLQSKAEEGSLSVEDFLEAVKALEKEVDDTKKLAEEVYDSEQKVLSIDERLESGQVQGLNEQKLEKIIRANQAEEEIVQQFLAEYQRLQKQVDTIEEFFKNYFGDASTQAAAEGRSTPKRDQLRDELAEVDQSVSSIGEVVDQMRQTEEQLENEENRMTSSRRGFLKAAGAAAATGAAGFTAGKSSQASGKKVASGSENIQNTDLKAEYNLYLTDLNGIKKHRRGNVLVKTVTRQIREDISQNSNIPLNDFSKPREINVDQLEAGGLDFWNVDGHDELTFKVHALELADPNDADQEYGMSISLGYRSSGATTRNFVASAGILYDTKGGGDWYLTGVSNAWAPEEDIGMAMDVLEPGELRSGSFNIYDTKSEIVNTTNVFVVLGLFIDVQTGEARYAPMELEVSFHY
jgi:hypothetical protein